MLQELPEELLLQIAFQLPDSATPKHLKNLCLTSRKLLPVAQEALHTSAKLSIACGCHPKVNAVVKLLRTLLDRPDLASKVKTLRFRAVRKRVDKLYIEQGFELLELRGQCISRLKEMGYRSPHPWRRSINNSIESAFGGLLLALLPNLTDLDFWIKDHQRGPPSSECLSGLWGGMSPPEAIIHGWKNISHLITGDTSVLKCGIVFEKLTHLDLRTISIGTVLRLNGPGSLQGAENLVDLTLTVSIQFADRLLVEKAEIGFSELLDALGCATVKNLKILFINDGYHIGDDLTTELNAGYFLDQLRSLHETLETLSITLETTDDDGELEWLVDMCQHPSQSLKDFTALRSLVVPQPFLFTSRSLHWNTEDACHPKDLPPNLEQLELMYPHEDVEEWVEGFLNEDYHATLYNTSAQSYDAQGRTSTFKKLTLTCREDVGIGASYFTEGVDKIWWNLSADIGIEAELYDQLRDTRQNLASLYEDEGMNDEDSVDEDDELDDEAEVDEDDWEDEDDDIRPRPRLPEIPQTLIPPGLAEQTRILKYLRDIPNPSEGATVDELAAVLMLPKDRVSLGTWYLLQYGNIRSTGTPDRDERLYFFCVSPELLRQDTLDEMMTDGNAGMNDSDTDESMPELETFEPDFEFNEDPAMGAPHTSSSFATPVITPTDVLRCLRDLPNPSQGLTIGEIASRLQVSHGKAHLAAYQLVCDGHILVNGDRVYFVSEDTVLRAEDMD